MCLPWLLLPHGCSRGPDSRSPRVQHIHLADSTIAFAFSGSVWLLVLVLVAFQCRLWGVLRSFRDHLFIK